MTNTVFVNNVALFPDKEIVSAGVSAPNEPVICWPVRAIVSLNNSNPPELVKDFPVMLIFSITDNEL